MKKLSPYLWVFFPLVIVIILIILIMKKNRLPRGLRNNNPGNIRYSKSNAWQGKIPDSEKTDNEFEEFTEMKWGVRAMTRLLHNYIVKNPNITLYEMISRYAPAVENDTNAYVNAVVKKVGVPKDTRGKDFYYHNVKNYLFILAIINHENGMGIDNEVVAKGISLAKLPFK